MIYADMVGGFPFAEFIGRKTYLVMMIVEWW